MAKRIFIAAFSYDDGADKDDIATWLGTLDNINDVIVWDSARDFVLDHIQVGPIDLPYLLGEAPE